jgi:hypothetical protein
VLEDVVDYCHN